MFKSLLKAFRVSNKPGVGNEFPNSTTKTYPTYDVNENGDPLCDANGSQWIRDAGDPIGFRDGANPALGNAGLYRQTWDIALAADHIFIGQSLGLGKPSAIFKIIGIFGDPAVPWAASPYYLQIFTPNNGVMPLAGAIPDFVIPAPRPNDGLGQAYIDFGVKTPFNCVNALSGGAAVVFSVTPDVFTSPGGVLGQINVNWAFYDYTV